MAAGRSTRSAESATRQGPSAVSEIPEALNRRVIIERIRPEIDGGRFPIKRTVGETVEVVASIFADGHVVVAAMLRYGDREAPMAEIDPGTDEWRGSFEVTRVGWHDYQIIAWIDRFQTWRRDLQKKSSAGQIVAADLLEGSMLVREAAARSGNEWLMERADSLSDTTAQGDRVALALSGELAAAIATCDDRSRATRSESRRVWVDRERARFGAWYEMFPRSAGTDPERSGTFRDASVELHRIAELGFDVVYLPPVHPIGLSYRKGRNNALVAEPG